MSQQDYYAWHGHFLMGLTSVKDIISVLEDQPRSETMKVGGLLLVLALLGLGVFTPWLGLVGDDWWFLTHLEDGNFPEAQLFENPARPGVGYLWMLIWRLFGLQLYDQ